MHCGYTAQECADLAKGMPKDASTAERIDYLRGNGLDVDYVVGIPKGANKIAVNDILNDTARAAQVAVGNLAEDTPRARNVTFYLQYNATKGWLPDLQQAGYDKFVTPINKDYSATKLAYLDAVKRQGDNAPLELIAHSWGSILMRNVLRTLAKEGYQNENLKVLAFGPAVRPAALAEPVKKIVEEEKYYQLLEDSRDVKAGRDPVVPALSFFSGPRDPVSGWVGFNWIPSRYTDNQSKDHLPGAVRTRAWQSLFSFLTMRSTVNPHSCYGLNCAGSQYNWTIEKAMEWGKKSKHEQ